MSSGNFDQDFYTDYEATVSNQPIPNRDSPYLTLDEAAEYARSSRKTLLNHKARGTLRAVRSRPPLFTEADLDAWVRGRRPRRGA